MEVPEVAILVVIKCVRELSLLHQKSKIYPNPTFGRRPQTYRRGLIRDPNKSWRLGLSVPLEKRISYDNCDGYYSYLNLRYISEYTL